MKKTKTTIAVAEAEAALNSKKSEVVAAEAALKLLQSELSAAHVALKQARLDADASLPQCRMIAIEWCSNRDIGNVVILRKTPSGMLVTRIAGDTSGTEYKFKLSSFSGNYVQAKKRPSFSGNHRELRDVPPEYMPEQKAKP